MVRARRSVVLATVTPLASIFGSGFLIVVPILERTLGAMAALGMAAVCAVAWMVGAAIRHNVAVVEPLAEAGRLDQITARIERASDLVIVVAYVISIALYVRILAQFVVQYASDGSGQAERLVGVGAIVLITVVGLVRGLSGLELLERLALGAVLVLVVAIGATFAADDLSQLVSSASSPPAVTGSVRRLGGARAGRHRHHRSGLRDRSLPAAHRPCHANRRVQVVPADGIARVRAARRRSRRR